MPCHLCSSSFFGIQGHVLPHRQANCKRIGHIHPHGALGSQSGWTSQGFSSLKSSPLPRLCIKNINLPSNFGEGENLATWIFEKKHRSATKRHTPESDFHFFWCLQQKLPLFAKKLLKDANLQEIPPDDCSVSHVFGVRSLWKKCCWNWVPVQALQAVPQLFLWSHAGQKLIWR